MRKIIMVFILFVGCCSTSVDRKYNFYGIVTAINFENNILPCDWIHLWVKDQSGEVHIVIQKSAKSKEQSLLSVGKNVVVTGVYWDYRGYYYYTWGSTLKVL